MPETPPGFRYATLVTVIYLDENRATDGRYRQLMGLVEDVKEAGLFEIE